MIINKKLLFAYALDMRNWAEVCAIKFKCIRDQVQVHLRASEVPTRLCELVSKEGFPVTYTKDYSYLKATIGSTRIARRAGM